MADNTLGNTTIRGQLVVTGNNVTLPSATIDDDNLNSGDPAGVDKTRHLPPARTTFGLSSSGAVASNTFSVHIASGSETLKSFEVSMNTTGSTGNSDFDLLVNGSSVLSAVVNIANGDTNQVRKTGTISSTSLSQGDFVEVQLTRNSSHDGTGPIAQVYIDRENAI